MDVILKLKIGDFLAEPFQCCLRTQKYSVSLILAFTGFGQAASITVGKGFGSGVNVLSHDYSPISNFAFAIGTFAVEPDPHDSFATLMDNFKEFARTSTPLVNGADTIIAVSSPFTAAPVSAFDFNGKPIYILVGNGGLVNSTQYALIKALNPTAGKWVFPANVAVADAGDAPMNSAANFTAIIGTRIDNAAGVDSLRFAYLDDPPDVPEPSSMFLVIGACAIGLRRRR